jgi:hypothetical protein
MRPEGFGYLQCERCGCVRKEGTLVERTNPETEKPLFVPAINQTVMTHGTWRVCEDVSFCDGVIAWLKSLEAKP